MTSTPNYEQAADCMTPCKRERTNDNRVDTLYDQKNSKMNPFQRLDPRTVLLVFPCALTCVFLLSNAVLRDFYFILYLFTILACLGRVTHSIVWTVILAATHTPLLVLNTPSYELVSLTLIIRKICMILCTGQILLAAVSVGDSINVMKKMKMHRALIIPTAICFRFIPTLIFEAGIIRDALKIRRLYSTKAILMHPFSTFEIFVSTFLFRTFVLGEELFFSLSTRGLNFKGNHFYQEVGFTYRDALFVLFTALYLVFVLCSPLPEAKI